MIISKKVGKINSIIKIGIIMITGAGELTVHELCRGIFFAKLPLYSIADIKLLMYNK